MNNIFFSKLESCLISTMSIDYGYLKMMDLFTLDVYINTV